MDGKIVPLFTLEAGQERFNKLCAGVQRMAGSHIRCYDLSVDVQDVPDGEACIAAGAGASGMAKELGYKRIYKIPDVRLFIDEPDHPRLGKQVIKYLGYVMAVEVKSADPAGQSTGPSTAQQSTPSVDENAPIIDPKDSGLKLPKEGLSMEEIKALFSTQYSQEEPFIFMSNHIEVAIYPDNPPGKRPIEFSLEEFYTILKIIEITKAKGVVWREVTVANSK